MIHQVAVRGTIWHVSKATGDDAANSGLSWRSPFATITHALAVAAAYDKIRVAGAATGYNEVLSVPVALNGLVIQGVGPRGSAWVTPSGANAQPLVVHADDVTLINLGLETNGSGTALQYLGRRLRAYESKFEGGSGVGSTAVLATKGSVAQVNAGTEGVGDDAIFEDCEFAWVTDAVKLLATDYGAVTQQRFLRCHFHNFSGRGFRASGLAGSTGIDFRDLWIHECFFADQENGTQPTFYLDLNPGDQAPSYNDGRVSGCHFPDVVASAKIVTAAKLVRSGNFYTNGHD